MSLKFLKTHFPGPRPILSHDKICFSFTCLSLKSKFVINFVSINNPSTFNQIFPFFFTKQLCDNLSYVSTFVENTTVNYLNLHTARFCQTLKGLASYIKNDPVKYHSKLCSSSFVQKVVRWV